MGQVQYSSARWGGTETCLGCHGGRASATGAPARSVGNFTLSTTHSQHLKYPAANINCQICHSKTTQTDAWTLKTYTAASHHVNGVREVEFSDIAYASYTSYKTSGVNNGKCNNTSCHGGLTRSTWSASTQNANHTCTHCHGVGTGVSAGMSVTGTNRYNLRFFAPGWNKTGTSTDQTNSSNNIRVGSHFKHLSSLYMKNIKCNECHQVPYTPFQAGTNHTLNTTRFNSATLTFGQASSARWDGVNSTTYTGFNGYTNGTAVKAATCSSVYCHGSRLKNGDTAGSYRKPYWNYSAMINYSNPATACARCHGNPPGSVTGSHNGKAATTSCSGCHPSVVDATGKIINKDLHINGKIESAGGDCLGCHDTLVAADFVRPSRHVNNGTTTSIVTNFDCIVCHAEGDANSSGTTINQTGNHGGGSSSPVALRNVDNAVTGAGTAGTNFWWWAGRRAAPLAKGAANTTYRDNMDSFCMGCHDANGASTIAVNNSNNGLIVGAAAVSTVRTTTTAKGGANSNTNSANLAQRPFNTEDNLRNANDAALAGNGTTHGTFRLTTYGRVLNVKSQFNSGNAAGTAWASHHNLNQYTKRYTSNNTTAGTGLATTVWTAYVTKENYTLNGTGTGTGMNAGLHCSDCHLNEVNAHGAVNSWYMLNGSATASDTDIAPTLGISSTSAEIMCFRCHAAAQYAVGGGGTACRTDHSARCNNIDVVTGTAVEAPLGNMCHGCHGGFGDTTQAVNQDVVGTGSTLKGRGSLGAIHGNNESYTPGGGSSTKRYRFMSGASMRFWNPSGTATPDWTATSGGTCYTLSAADQWGSCTKHSGGTGQTINRGRSLSY
jgi:predicted CxxxxCH...CXXCH cytochrome family protein